MKIKVLKNLFKRIIIYIVVFMILLSDLSLPLSAYSPEDIEGAVANFARHTVKTYGSPEFGGNGAIKYRRDRNDEYDNPSKYGGEHNHTRIDNPVWSSNSYTWANQYIYFDCSSFASACWHQVVPSSISVQSSYSLIHNSFSYFDRYEFDYEHPESLNPPIAPGDIMVREGHAWVYIGGTEQTANMGYYSNPYKPDYGGLRFKTLAQQKSAAGTRTTYYLRLKEEKAAQITEINGEIIEGGFGSTTTSGITGTGQDFSNFFFNGIPDGKYSVASRKSIFQLIIEALAAILNFLIGLITYLIRGLIISFISIFDRELNTTIKAIGEADVEVVSLEDMGLSSTSADDPHSGNRVITIEELVFDQLDLFDVNIFK